MRLTNTTLLRGYNRALNRLKTAKNDCENKITSQRRFSRASEMPLAAAKALNVRKSQYYDAQYKENLKVASTFYTEAETSLLQVSSKMAEIRETIIAACNTTKEGMDLKIYAQQLETNAKELCAIFNTDSAGRSIFGGESNDHMPFEIINDSSGNAATVLYHGVPVNAMNNYDGFPYTDRVYSDIGLGMVTDQKAHTHDPLSLLDISFIGTEISGCGAERCVADVDLSSIIPKRTYVFDIYADGVKKTIDFQAIPKDDGNGKTILDTEGTIALINDKLNEAYKKNIVNGQTHPVMDEQGVVYLVDKDGNAVEDGIVTIVNNTVSDKSKRAEQLVVDNDSGYTNKFRLKAELLPEGENYKIDVKVGDEKKTIEFVTGTDVLSDSTDPIYREAVTIKNFQAALDEAFGEGVVNISDHSPTMGIVSAEGKQVELIPNAEQQTEDAEKAKLGANIAVNTSTVTKLNIDNMKVRTSGSDKTFKFTVSGKSFSVTITPPDVDTMDATTAGGNGDGDVSDAEYTAYIIGAVNKAMKDSGFMLGNDGYIVNDKGDKQVITAKASSSTIVDTETTYKLTMDGLEDGKDYSVKVVVGNKVENITFTAGADEVASINSLQAALDAEFGNNTVKVGTDGTVTADGKSVSVANNTSDPSSAVFERDKIFSNNYIQLTLDAARALRNGDIEYANACIDRIVTANEKLLVEIADLGCNEDFIDFNLERITTREYNLAERQNDLEASNPEEMITLWKQYEAYYNACLQMSSSVIPNSIFNYMK